MNKIVRNDANSRNLSSIKDRLFKIGYKDEKACAGTSILLDHHIEHINVNSKDVEIIPIGDALKRYDWVQDLMFGLIKRDDNEILQQMTSTILPPIGYFVKVAEGATVKLPLQLFTILQQPQARQHIHNIMVIGREAKVDILSGSVVPESLRQGIHTSISETYIGENAHCRSISVENWGKEMEVYSFSATKLEEGARDTNVSIRLGEVKKHYSYSKTFLEKESNNSSSSIVFANKGTERIMYEDIYLNGETSNAESIARMVTDGGKIQNASKIIGNADFAKGFLCCDGLMLQDSGEIYSTPSVQAHSAKVYLSHEASVGMISQDKLDYLMACGLDQEQARDLIVQGFLEFDKQKIPESMRDMVEQMIAYARSGAM